MKTFLVILALFCSGCISVGYDFRSDRVHSIVNNETTKLDLVGLFGMPFRKGIDNGNQTWTYVFNKYSLINGTMSKDLYIVFDKDAKVISYTFNSTE